MKKNKISFLKELEKKVIVKKTNKKKTWKNSIYGFECANWTNKC